MEDKYESIDEESLLYLLDHEIDRRKAVEKKVISIIRANVLILGIFVPTVAIVLREDFINSISAIIWNPYTLGGLTLSIVSIGSSSLIFWLSHSQLSSISGGVDNVVENTDQDEKINVKLAKQALENSEPFNDLVRMMVLAVFFTCVSVPLFLLGVATPFVSIDAIAATYVVVLSISGVTLTYVAVKIGWQSSLKTYRIFRDSIFQIRQTTQKATEDIELSGEDLSNVIATLSLGLGIGIGIHLTPVLPIFTAFTVSSLIDSVAIFIEYMLIAVVSTLIIFLFLTILVSRVGGKSTR